MTTELSPEDQDLLNEARTNWPEHLREWDSMNFEAAWRGIGIHREFRTIIFVPAHERRDDPAYPCFRVFYNREMGFSKRPLGPEGPPTDEVYKDLIPIP